MLKMFTTQLTGVFKRIQDNSEFAFEDAARLLAQAAISDHSIYLFGLNEMEAVVLEAITGAEPLHAGKKLSANAHEIETSDRAILVTRYSNDHETIQLAKKLQAKSVPFVVLATKVDSEGGEDLFDLADVGINLQLTKGLLPDETGNRFGFPTAMAALYAYYGLKFTLDEILAEYAEELE